MSTRLKNSLFWLFIVVFTLGALEFAAAYYLQEIRQKATEKKFQFDSYRVYAHKPGFREGDGKKDWIIMNNQGFRREADVKKPKPEGVFRAFFLGGSAAAGVSSPPPYPLEHVYMDETIDAHLETMLEVAFPEKNIEIINAAAAGYRVHQHTAYLLSDLLNYEPDLVIFMDGINDHFFHNPNQDFYGDFKYQFWKERLQEPSLSGLWDYFANYMADYSALFRGYFAWRLQQDATQMEQRPPLNYRAESDEAILAGYHEAAPRGYLRSIQTNLDILARHDVKALLAFQPILALRDKDKLSQQESSFYTEPDYMKLLYPEIMDDLRALAALNKVNLIDLIPVFNAPEYAGQQLMIDYAHMNSAGGKAIAKALFPAVRDMVAAQDQPAVHTVSMEDDQASIVAP